MISRDKVILADEVEQHRYCPECYKWDMGYKQIVCGWCTLQKRTLLSVMNCSTDLQNVSFKNRNGIVTFKLTKDVATNQELFENYGAHIGHVGCHIKILFQYYTLCYCFIL